MKQPTDHLEAAARRIHMNAEEHAKTRANLSMFMRANPMRQAVPSPYMHFFRPLAMVLSLVLVISGGTSAFASKALPGDKLYMIKVSVVEPTIGAFKTTPEAKASWNAELATKRLSEAQTLAQAGKLTPEIKTDLAARIAVSATETAKQVDAIAAADPAAAVHASIALDTALEVHQAVLAELAQDDQDVSAPVILALNDQNVNRGMRTSATFMLMAAPTRSEDTAVSNQDAAGSAPAQEPASSSLKLRVLAPALAPEPLEIAPASSSVTATTTITASTSQKQAKSKEKPKEVRKFDERAYQDASALFMRAHEIAEQSKEIIRNATTTSHETGTSTRRNRVKIEIGI